MLDFDALLLCQSFIAELFKPFCPKDLVCKSLYISSAANGVNLPLCHHVQFQNLLSVCSQVPSFWIWSSSHCTPVSIAPAQSQKNSFGHINVSSPMSSLVQITHVTHHAGHVTVSLSVVISTGRVRSNSILILVNSVSKSRWSSQVRSSAFGLSWPPSASESWFTSGGLWRQQEAAMPMVAAPTGAMIRIDNTAVATIWKDAKNTL